LLLAPRLATRVAATIPAAGTPEAVR
jgi:hypothetical protein